MTSLDCVTLEHVPQKENNQADAFSKFDVNISIMQLGNKSPCMSNMGHSTNNS